MKKRLQLVIAASMLLFQETAESVSPSVSLIFSGI